MYSFCVFVTGGKTGLVFQSKGFWLWRELTDLSENTTHKTRAVRIPAEVRFPDGVKQVLVEVVGNTRVLIPVGSVWESSFDDPSPVSEDFMAERADDMPPTPTKLNG